MHTFGNTWADRGLSVADAANKECINHRSSAGIQSRRMYERFDINSDDLTVTCISGTDMSILAFVISG